MDLHMTDTVLFVDVPRQYIPSLVYTSYFIRSYFSATDPLFVLLVIDCIYFLALYFGFFSPLSACMWWICLLIILIHYLNICHFTLKLINLA
jgi:hypothetical protein